MAVYNRKDIASNMKNAIKNRDLKEYLYNVFLVEKRLYELDLFYDKLDEKRDWLLSWVPRRKATLESASSDVNSEEAIIYRETDERYKEDRYILYFFVIIASCIVTHMINPQPYISLKWFFNFIPLIPCPRIIFAVVVGAFYGIIISAVIYSVLSHHYDMKSKINFYKRIEELNKKIELENEKSKQIVQNKISIVEQELNEVSEYIDKLSGIKESLYNLNVIYPKYRNFVAICSIYEYLDSGRCTSLTGAHGAYNKYEEEIRLGIVIDRLDKVLNKLNQIIENQELIYDAICKSNKKIDKMMVSMDQSLKRLESIEQNSEITSYNSKIIADNSKYQSFLMSIKYLEDNEKYNNLRE